MYQALIQPTLWVLTLGTAATFAILALWAWRKKRPARTRAKVALAALAVALIVVPAVGVVPAGARGVVYNWSGGISKAERGEGITILAPWIQHMSVISVRTKKVFSAKVFSQSSDLQEITVVASINFHIDPAMAAELYQRIGASYAATVIQPALYQRTKAEVGKVKAIDFAEQRDKLAQRIQQQLTAQLAGYGIVVEYVNIEDAIFDPKFVLAVKNKVIAEQKAAEQRNLIEAEAAKKEQVIIQAEARARSIIIEAEKQAKANRAIHRSLTPMLLQWKWLSTWNGTLPTTLVGGKDTGLLLGIGGGTYSGFTP